MPRRRPTEVYCVYISSISDTSRPHMRVVRYLSTKGFYILERTAAALFINVEEALDQARSIPPHYGFAGVELFVPTGDIHKDGAPKMH